MYAGCRQVFIRLAGCNLRCAYCDTPLPAAPERCRVEQTPGLRDFAYYKNPMPVETASLVAHSFDLSLHHSVSLTGGEPLLHPETIYKLAPLLRRTRRGVYLESNGTLPEQLAKVIEWVDIIAMDIKLPSATGLSPLWEEHRRFLGVAVAKEVFVKIVAGNETTAGEIEKAAQLVQTAGAGIPLVIQPLTKAGGQIGVSPERLLVFQRIALEKLVDVRVIPQTHKTTGQL